MTSISSAEAAHLVVAFFEWSYGQPIAMPERHRIVGVLENGLETGEREATQLVDYFLSQVFPFLHGRGQHAAADTAAARQMWDRQFAGIHWSTASRCDEALHAIATALGRPVPPPAPVKVMRAPQQAPASSDAREADRIRQVTSDWRKDWAKQQFEQNDVLRKSMIQKAQHDTTMSILRNF